VGYGAGADLLDPEVVVHYAVAFVAVSEPLFNAMSWQLVRLPLLRDLDEGWDDAGDAR
jgi:hypothetical protein